jgi:hypothetical protein
LRTLLEHKIPRMRNEGVEEVMATLMSESRARQAT